MFQRNRTNFEYKTEGELGMINTDPLRLQQIINNLLSNAMKYTPPEKAIGLYVKPAGDNLEIKIWDTGFGISPENQAKLFTPYFRIKNEQTRNIMGTGLGLTLTKKLAELLGITISLESTLNEGTVFTLTISNRTNQENEENEKNKTTNELPFLKEALRNHSFKTLIVEDNATSIGILTAIFKNIGKQTTAEIVFARDSSEALELAKNNNFSLIISDINFGYGLNGYELLNELKKISYPEANAPIIIAHSATNDPNKYLAAGFNAFLPKAILPVDFYKTLHRLLIENK